MKKKLEAELISIAHRILKMGDRSTLPLLQEEAKNVYEKLTILAFAEAHFTGPQPTIGQVRQALESTEEAIISNPVVPEEIPVAETSKEVQTVLEIAEEVVEEQPVTEEIVEQEAVAQEPEPVMDEVVEQKAIAQEQVVEEEVEEAPTATLVPEETPSAKPELIIEKINERVTGDLFIPATEVAETPLPPTSAEEEAPVIPEPAETTPAVDEKPKSLNEQLKRGIHIGLNDRLAFIKHLFEGSSTDYNRVLSQLNTLNSKSEATAFIDSMVKPDYNSWQDKKEYEERFMTIITRKYES